MIYKLPYQHQKGRTEVISRFKKYLEKHKGCFLG